MTINFDDRQQITQTKTCGKDETVWKTPAMNDFCALIQLIKDLNEMPLILNGFEQNSSENQTVRSFEFKKVNENKFFDLWGEKG